jgi:uncharacterized membrane protein YdjX (TVP38/TMEM64 family)
VPQPASSRLRPQLTWSELRPSLRLGAGVVVLFGAALLLARAYSGPIEATLAGHPRLGVLIFVATSALAVLMPLLTNLPLVPLAVLAWGPAWTALLLLFGWLAGAAIAFALGRHARAAVLRHFPSVQRHAGIDRLIHPQRRLVSLILLRMTFPVDVLSYALGLFSRRTTAAENLVSTAVGAAPFALLFAFYPALPATAQLTVFGVCLLVFAVYLNWIVRRPGAQDTGG